MKTSTFLATAMSFLALSCAPAARPVGSTQPPPSEHPSGPSDVPAWLTETDAAARAAGAGQAQILESGAGVPGDALGGLVNVPKNRCALVYARGTSGLEDLDLLAFGEDGGELGGDESPDAHPTLLLCPETERRVHVSARVVQGRGLLSLVVHDVPPERLAHVRSALSLGKEGEGGHKAETWPGLEAAVTEHRAQIGGSWLDLRRVAVPVDSRLPSRISANVPARGCIDVLALASSEAVNLELDVLDENGRIFARGLNHSDQRWSVVCAGEQPTEVSFEVRPLSGRGIVLFVLSTTQNSGERPELSRSVFPHGLPARALSAAGAEPSATSPATRLAVGEISSTTLQFAGCARLELSPAEPLLGYEARVWSRSGQLLAEAVAVAASSLFVCTPGPGARLDLTATRRSGPLGLVVGPARKLNPEFDGLALGLSRLLTRLHLGHADWLDPLPTIERLELRPEQLARVDFVIPEGRCLQLVAALDAGAHGLELGLRDRASDRELGSERGAHSVSASLCSERRQPRSVRAELRTASGQASALLASQLTPAR